MNKPIANVTIHIILDSIHELQISNDIFEKKKKYVKNFITQKRNFFFIIVLKFNIPFIKLKKKKKAQLFHFNNQR